MKVLGNMIKNNINEGKYLSVDKILKENIIKNRKRGHSPYIKNTMILPQGLLRSEQSTGTL